MLAGGRSPRFWADWMTLVPEGGEASAGIWHPSGALRRMKGRAPDPGVLDRRLAFFASFGGGSGGGNPRSN